MVPRVASTVAPRLACGPVQGLAQVVRGYSTHDEGVLEYLLKVEKDGEEYYRDLAAKAPNKGFQRIFTMLADEEQKHYAAIEDMAHSGETRLGKSTILGVTKTIFEEVRADPNVDFLSSKDQLAVYTEARDIEARNRDEYVKRAKSVKDPKVRALFELVAAEEQKHYVMLDELIQFIGKAEPGSGRWTESAEFNRLDDDLYDNYKY
uniref:Rubrerythrin diiron-binding domain-containing protein n=1 Tax=Eutreptiella gymnastica TaxID=73025 RepID=A0A7S4GDA3_9EUGL